MPHPADMSSTIEAVVTEVDAIVQELRLVVHLLQIEHHGLNDELRNLDERLAAGWVPEGSPVEDVVERLRRSLPADS